MNIALRKLAMLEKNIVEREESAKMQGYATNGIDSDLKKRITNIMNKIRDI